MSSPSSSANTQKYSQQNTEIFPTKQRNILNNIIHYASNRKPCTNARHHHWHCHHHCRHRDVLDTFLSWSSAKLPKVPKPGKAPQLQIFCRCNIFEIVAIVNLRHRMIICQKIRLSQPIEMCTQFTRTQMPHIFPRNEHRKIFSTIQRQFLNTTEIYSGGSKAVWSFSENSSKFGNSIVPYLGRQI